MIAFVSSLYDYFSAWADEKSFFHRMSPVLFRYQFVIPGEIDVSIIDKLRSEIRTLDFMPNKESGTIFFRQKYYQQLILLEKRTRQAGLFELFEMKLVKCTITSHYDARETQNIVAGRFYFSGFVCLLFVIVLLLTLFGDDFREYIPILIFISIIFPLGVGIQHAVFRKYAKKIEAIFRAESKRMPNEQSNDQTT